MSPNLLSQGQKQFLAPLVFVLLWSTSWPVVKFAMPYADPLTFLALRFEFAALAAVLIAYAGRARQPESLGELGHMLFSGVFMFALYTGGMWWSVVHGLPMVVSALIAATQPLMTAAISPFFGEKTTERQWLGVFVGFCGVAMVLSPHLSGVESTVMPIIVTFVAIFSFSLGTFHQKYYIPRADARTLFAYQYIGGLLVMFPAAWIFEPMYFELQIVTTLVLMWAVIAQSIFAMMLYLYMTRQKSVTPVAALIYLVPPLVAIQGYVFFGEVLTLLQFGGMLMVAAGVYLATRVPRRAIEIEAI
ncbi:MAG: DMT family transporter [Pseudomonadota bacterium]